MKRIIYTLITILTLTFCFYIISNKVYANDITDLFDSYNSYESENGHDCFVFEKGPNGYRRCAQCGRLFPEENKNTSTTIIIVIIGFILAVAAYIALSIRKKIKDKKYYSNDE